MRGKEHGGGLGIQAGREGEREAGRASRLSVKSASHEVHSELQENIGGVHLYATLILKSFLDGIH